MFSAKSSAFTSRRICRVSAPSFRWPIGLSTLPMPGLPVTAVVAWKNRTSFTAWGVPGSYSMT